MYACTVTIPVGSVEGSELHALVIEPNSAPDNDPVLLFLHGMGEAGSSLGELPKVCIHQTPPFQAILGRLPETLVIAPQAPPVPNMEAWNWRGYVKGLGEFMADRYAKRRIVATGFSRGGLGVLQLISAFPDLVNAWAVVDPQPARDELETSAILRSQQWVRRDGFATVTIAAGATLGKTSARYSSTIFRSRAGTRQNSHMSKWQSKRIRAICCRETAARKVSMTTWA
jgi:pimeloyl-ACP methyl ester carboxylesterase